MMISIYGHGGCRNHGNEAILRGFKELQESCNDQSITKVYSYYIDADKQWGITSLFQVLPMIEDVGRYSLRHIRNYFLRQVGLEETEMSIRFSQLLKNVEDGSVFLLEAGDQYCEPPSRRNRIRDWYFFLNREINKLGGKTVMLYCTIPVDSMEDSFMIDDLKQYALIIARESITYNALISHGLKNVIFSPCCAFLMKPKDIILPKVFSERSVVGITVGEIAQNKQTYNDSIRNSSIKLINYILNETDYGIALIPHVHGGVPDDLRLLSELNHLFNDDRVVLIQESRADEIKYVVSHLEMDITIRTHVSVAAYSSFVPTIVIGYSQKSIGIAKDIFGSSDHYVIDIGKLSDDTCLINEFRWLDENKEKIRQHLKDTIPEYEKKIMCSFAIIKQLSSK